MKKRSSSSKVALAIYGATYGAVSLSTSTVHAVTGGIGTDTLTGMIVYGTNSAGGYTNYAWNTYGPDGHYNLYLTQNGSFINSGNSSATSINIPLSPGTYTYGMYADGGFSGGYFGANFFFDGPAVGAQNTSSISVYAPLDETTSPTPFYADSSSSTLVLTSGPSQSAFGLTPGSGALSFTDGPEVISLTAFNWTDYTVNNVNLVSPYSLGGTSSYNPAEPDYVGGFTLQVTQVPEPASLLQLGVASVGFLGRRRARRLPAG